MLHAADHILELTLLLLPKHIDIIDSMSPFAEIMTIVLQGEEFYFKNNSQLHYKQHVPKHSFSPTSITRCSPALSGCLSSWVT